MILENSALSLEAVKKTFEDFRKTKNYRGQPFPESLWQMTRALTSTHTPMQIYRTLNIGQTAYQQHVLQETIKPDTKRQRFVPLPIPTVPKVIAKATLPNGIVLEFLCPVALSTLMRAPHATTHTPL